MTYIPGPVLSLVLTDKHSGDETYQTSELRIHCFLPAQTNSSLSVYSVSALCPVRHQHTEEKKSQERTSVSVSPLPFSARCLRKQITDDGRYIYDNVAENPPRHTLDTHIRHTYTQTHTEDKLSGYPTQTGDSRKWTGNREIQKSL